MQEHPLHGGTISGGGEANLASAMMDVRGAIVNVHVKLHYVTFHVCVSKILTRESSTPIRLSIYIKMTI
jgi:hypothetical protein